MTGRWHFVTSLTYFSIASATVVAQTWEPAPTIPTVGNAARISAVGVNHQGLLYAIGGTPWLNGGDMDGSVHRLATGATNWETLVGLEGLGPVLGQAAGVDSLGRLIVYGGFIANDDGPGDEASYDPIEGPQGNIAARAVPETAIGYTAFATDDVGRLYGLGGGPGAGGPNSGYCDRYDAATDSWQTLVSMPTPVADACAAFDGNGHIMVCGGINAPGNARTANVAQYDIASGAWSDAAIPDLPIALSGASAARGIDGRVYVAGGEVGAIGAGVTQTTVYKWDPANNMWTTVAEMATPRKHFAFALGNDDYLYAIGGDNDTGGTNLVEKLFTPRCPSLDVQPGDLTAWSGTIAGFSVAVSGASPLMYQWRRDGQPLADGPTGSGSTIAGATTAALKIATPSAADEAMYDVVASNSCGASTSNAAVLTIRMTPEIPVVSSQWTVTNLHPGWAQDSSYARGVSGGRIGGEATTPTLLPDGRTLTLSHPVVWENLNSAGMDVTPGNSIGGAIRDVSGDLFVGWFWHIYNCPPPTGGTCGWQSAAYWTGENLAFTEAVHSSGPEYDHCVGTDGTAVVGTLTYEYSEGNYSSRATMWTPPGSAVSLHSTAVGGNSGASAVDGEYQYGSATSSPPGPITHAARWSGSAASYLDIHPEGFARSWVSGAGDGQAVGTAVQGAVNHAMMWVGGSTTIDLNPVGQSSSATDAHGGLQVGNVGAHAAIWAGTAESYFDLNTVLPAEYSGAVADAIEVAEDGTIYVAGGAYVPSRSRYEAIVWRSLPSGVVGDVNCDGVVNSSDVPYFASVLLGVDTQPCHMDAADLTGDGLADGNDAQLFLEAVLAQ